MADISKTTVLILLILTILVSVMGTITVLETAVVQNNQPSGNAVESNPQASISLEIAEQKAPKSDEKATVSLVIA